jgi:hypothetical protein
VFLIITSRNATTLENSSLIEECEELGRHSKSK